MKHWRHNTIWLSNARYVLQADNWPCFWLSNRSGIHILLFTSQRKRAHRFPARPASAYKSIMASWIHLLGSTLAATRGPNVYHLFVLCPSDKSLHTKYFFVFLCHSKILKAYLTRLRIQWKEFFITYIFFNLKTLTPCHAYKLGLWKKSNYIRFLCLQINCKK